MEGEGILQDNLDSSRVILTMTMVMFMLMTMVVVVVMVVSYKIMLTAEG